jgi:hypothetical protein
MCPGMWLKLKKIAKISDFIRKERKCLLQSKIARIAQK